VEGGADVCQVRFHSDADAFLEGGILDKEAHMRRTILAVLLPVVMAAGVGAIAWAAAASLGASSFSSNGSAISGWHWLRSAGQTATWTFDGSQLAGAQPGKVYLNVTALVTNGVNGGSGYDTPIKLKVTSASASQTVTVALKNPFKPKDPENSGGVGYTCYGSGGPVSSKIVKGGGEIKITTSYPFTKGCHVAVNAGSVSMGFVRR